MENYLVNGKDVGLGDDKCVLPIFITSMDEYSGDVFNTWFLGNMFLDRYFVMHDMDWANEALQELPRIGLYDKWADRTTVHQPEPNFERAAGHCSDQAGKKRKDVDYKEVGKWETHSNCRHTCYLDDECSGYEYYGFEKICAHWYGDIEGDESVGVSCYMKERRPVVPPKEEEESGGGASAFWGIFVTLLILVGGGVLIKFKGKEILGKIQDLRGGGGTFQTTPDLYSGDTAPMMDSNPTQVLP